MLRKQKRLSFLRNSVEEEVNNPMIKDYRSSIVPVQFSLREIDHFSSMSSRDLQVIEIGTIEEDKLRELVVDCLMLSFIYDPLKQTLDLSASKYFNHHHHLKNILKILFQGEFYRFIHNTENQLKILVNNRMTQSNVKILLAALLIYGSRKLSIQEISTAMLFFTLEAALTPDSINIPPDNQRIVKLLKKIERVIKPNEFKFWMEAVKTHQEYSGQIEAHHFLYLVSMSQKRLSNGLHKILFQPSTSTLFKNANNHVNGADFEIDQGKEMIEKKKVVRGLTFAQPRKRSSFSFSKEILKQFRLRNPSKNKRPDTGMLRKRVQSFCQLAGGKSAQPSPQQKSNCRSIPPQPVKCQFNIQKSVKTGSKLQKGSLMLRKPDFKLML